MNITKLQNLIESKVYLEKESSTGFRMTKCPCCNDYKVRAGWKMDSNEIVYNCFNCQKAGSFKLGDDRLTKNFISILKDFGISENELSEITYQLFFNKQKEDKVISLSTLNKTSTYTPEVKLPEKSRRLQYEDVKEIEYLTNRNIDWKDYPFYISEDKQFHNRIIIPFYKQGKIIYWQARAIDNNKLRYLNCSVKKEAVIFNHDEMYRNYDLPLFVCEGIFDALCINGISIIGSKLNETKIEILRKCRRTLIFVIDADDNGKKLGKKVLEENLGYITFPTKRYYNSKEDINSMIISAGKSWTIYQLLQNKTKEKFSSTIILNMI